MNLLAASTIYKSWPTSRHPSSITRLQLHSGNGSTTIYQHRFYFAKVSMLFLQSFYDDNKKPAEAGLRKSNEF